MNGSPQQKRREAEGVAAEQSVQVRFEPSGKEVQAIPGATLMDLALSVGLHINASCGGEGTCGTCKVRVLEGEAKGGKHSKLSPQELDQGFRLACTAKATEHLRVEIPASSLLDHAVAGRARTLRGAQARSLIRGFRIDPAVFKLPVRLWPPSREDVLPDLDRLLRTLKQEHSVWPVSVSFAAMRNLAPILRASDWQVTLTLVDLGNRYRLIHVEPGDMSDQNYAVVVDIGTTSLAAQLLDLRRCEVVDGLEGGVVERQTLAVTSMYNPQVSYGEDVITRILHASRPGGLETLQRVVIEGINQLLERMLERSAIPVEYVSHMVVAGNSTMTQIFLGLDPRSIRSTPYVTTVSEAPVVRARQLGVALGEHVPVWCFPLVASWVGGDIVAGALASGLWQDEETTLLIDLGTNGEVVLGNKDWAVTTSCSAGPAFEGGGIRCGMRAARGAIEDILVDPETLEPSISTIGGRKPRGICGSGLIASVAELFSKGILAPNGRYHEEVRTPRLRVNPDGGREYVLAWGRESETGQDVVLTEVDIDNFIRAKAAIYAGCRVLLDSVGMTFEEVDRVMVAGGFGDSLDLRKSIRVGLLPPLPLDRFLFIGNSALLGARLVSFSHDLFDQAKELAQKMTHVDLADNPAFMDQYVAAMFLPHTDADAFPRS